MITSTLLAAAGFGVAKAEDGAKAVPLRAVARRAVNRATGIILAINFVVLWALPIAGMGQAFHLGLIADM